MRSLRKPIPSILCCQRRKCSCVRYKRPTASISPAEKEVKNYLTWLLLATSLIVSGSKEQLYASRLLRWATKKGHEVVVKLLTPRLFTKLSVYTQISLWILEEFVL